MSAVYAAAYPAYRDYGWAPIKIGARTKGEDEAGRSTIPKGFTGWNGVDPSGADCHDWAEQEPDGNIAIRLADDMIGIDVDNYDGKRGGETIAEAEKRWGRLPYSPRSGSRDDPASGIWLYRIPRGTVLDGMISFPELGLGGIDIIQRHHRIVVCWPSIHPEGRVYRWHGIDGGVLDEPPHPDDIPELPAAWLEALRKPEKVNGTELGDGDLYNVKDALTKGDPSPKVAQRLGVAMAALYSGACRHDSTRDHVLALLRYGEQGETGVEPALLAYREAFANNVASNRPGGRDEAIGEFNDFVNGEKVARLLAEPSSTDWTDLIGNTAFDPDEGQAGTENKTPVLADIVLTRSALQELPDPEPLIDNVLDQGTVALLYGRWGTGKSFIGIDMAASVGTGRPWQGRHTEQRRALYVAAEGAYGLKGRLHAWEKGWRTQIADDDLSILPRPVNLTNHAEVANLAALVKWGGYSFIALDTLARCMVGADENSAKDCGEVVDVLHRLREQTPNGRGVVLGIHHTGKDGKTFRGSSVFEAGADTVYSVNLDGAVIVLDREKRKDGPRVDNHRLKLDPIDGTGSVVVGSSHGVGTNGAADKLLSHFKSHFEVTGASGPTLRDSVDLPKTTYYRAVSDLLKRGDLINNGTVIRPFYELAAK